MNIIFSKVLIKYLGLCAQRLAWPTRPWSRYCCYRPLAAALLVLRTWWNIYCEYSQKGQSQNENKTKKRARTTLVSLLEMEKETEGATKPGEWIEIRFNVKKKNISRHLFLLLFLLLLLLLLRDWSWSWSKKINSLTKKKVNVNSLSPLFIYSFVAQCTHNIYFFRLIFCLVSVVGRWTTDWLLLKLKTWLSLSLFLSLSRIAKHVSLLK